MPEDRNAMSLREITAWAWRETSPVHMNRTNLLIHIVAVPLFVAGHILLVAGLLLDWRLIVGGALSILVSLIAQKRGHALERTQVHPFEGPRDFVRRLYAEQFWNFWHFLFSGQWRSSLRSARTKE